MGDTIECALGPGAKYASVCTLERVSVSEFVVHQPDGGFRRFVRDPSEVSPHMAIRPADGSNEIGLRAFDMEPGMVEIGLANERYKFPVQLIEPTHDD
ncbi:hypothetical protein ACI5KX_08220 [Erythrobacter sp. GH1-10]|uniref:hypothetical protein n=1 Tax=Erythrobacter sp. GH1-10 TaxID=3349334 RepID=UPI003878353C